LDVEVFMDVGTILVIIAIVLGAIALFVEHHFSHLLGAAVIVGFFGVLLLHDVITL
jgi:hypothetical protein